MVIVSVTDTITPAGARTQRFHDRRDRATRRGESLAELPPHVVDSRLHAIESHLGARPYARPGDPSHLITSGADSRTRFLCVDDGGIVEAVEQASSCGGIASV